MSEVYIKNEGLFVTLSCSNVEPNEMGRKQFYEEQSLGVKALKPDPYYLSLVEGKTNFDFLFTEYKKMYLSGEWWGFLLLWKDWEGKRWVLPHLCKWYVKITERELPEWLHKEITYEALREELF